MLIVFELRDEVGLRLVGSGGVFIDVSCCPGLLRLLEHLEFAVMEH